MVDLSKVKIELIPNEEVPISRVRETPWDDLFNKIPKGQTLVLKEPQVLAGSIRAALTRRQGSGKFKNLRLRTKGKRGSRTLYLMNIEKNANSVLKIESPKK